MSAQNSGFYAIDNPDALLEAFKEELALTKHQNNCSNTEHLAELYSEDNPNLNTGLINHNDVSSILHDSAELLRKAGVATPPPAPSDFLRNRHRSVSPTNLLNATSDQDQSNSFDDDNNDNLNDTLNDSHDQFTSLGENIDTMTHPSRVSEAPMSSLVLASLSPAEQELVAQVRDEAFLDQQNAVFYAEIKRKKQEERQKQLQLQKEQEERERNEQKRKDELYEASLRHQLRQFVQIDEYHATQAQQQQHTNTVESKCPTAISQSSDITKKKVPTKSIDNVTRPIDHQHSNSTLTTNNAPAEKCYTTPLDIDVDDEFQEWFE